jgi:hypothetical protein
MKYFDWFRLFVAECRKLKYEGNLSPDGGFEDWYIEGKTPEEAAIIYVEEMAI